MNKKPQSSSVHIILVAVLSLTVIGCLGYVYWQNYANPNEVAVQELETKNEPDTEPQASIDATSDVCFLLSSQSKVNCVDVNGENEVQYSIPDETNFSLGMISANKYSDPSRTKYFSWKDYSVYNNDSSLYQKINMPEDFAALNSIEFSSWSRDGDSLYFDSCPYTKVGDDGYYPYDICKYSLLTKSFTKITNGAGNRTYYNKPFETKDGRIVYVSVAVGSGRYILSVMDDDGTSMKALTSFNDSRYYGIDTAYMNYDAPSDMIYVKYVDDRGASMLAFETVSQAEAGIAPSVIPIDNMMTDNGGSVIRLSSTRLLLVVYTQIADYHDNYIRSEIIDSNDGSIIKSFNLVPFGMPLGVIPNVGKID